MASGDINSSGDSPSGEVSEIFIKSRLKTLQKVIYLADHSLSYVAGDPELFFLKDFALKLSFIGEILTNSENLGKFLDILIKANNDENLPRRITLFYVLAYALRNHSPDDDKITNQLAETVLEVCRTDEEFFRFIKVFASMKGKGRDLKKEEAYNKITTSMGRVIRKFLDKKTPMEFAKAVVKSKSYHGWKYKDLIKLSHYKSETAEKLLITEYVLFGLDSVEIPKTEGLKSIYKLLNQWSKLGKPETSVETTCKLVVELEASYNRINSKYIKSQEVWGAMIPYLPVEEVMRLLPKFHKFNMLQPTKKSIVYGKVLDVLTVSNVRSQKVNPLQIFIHWKNFEKGGKRIDPKLEEYLKNKKLEAKSPSPISADNPIAKLLRKCMQNAYPLDPTMLGLRKRIVLAIDLTDADSVCFKQRNISCLEAQLALAMYYYKTEKNIEIVVFDGDEVKKIDLDKSSYEANLKKLKEIKNKAPNPSSLFNWAKNNKKKVDVFICVLQSAKSLVITKEFRDQFREGSRNYQKANLVPGQHKIVIICLALHNFAPFSEFLNILTVGGFCPEIPKVIHSFVNGNILKDN